MKFPDKRVFFLLLLVSFCSAMSAQTKTVKVTFPPVERVWNKSFEGKLERKFEELEHKLSDAERLGDGSILKELYGDKLMILGVPYAKDQWIQLLVSGKGTFVNYEKQIQRIAIYGNTVIISGVQIVDSVQGNSSSSYQYNFMSTWLRGAKDNWQCVALAGDQIKSRI